MEGRASNGSYKTLQKFVAQSNKEWQKRWQQKHLYATFPPACFRVPLLQISVMPASMKRFSDDASLSHSAACMSLWQYYSSLHSFSSYKIIFTHEQVRIAQTNLHLHCMQLSKRVMLCGTKSSLIFIAQEAHRQHATWNSLYRELRCIFISGGSFVNSPNSIPISADNLPTAFMKRHCDSDLLFQSEFEVCIYKLLLLIVRCFSADKHVSLHCW